MAGESPEPEISVRGFWRTLMSSSPDASYGRVISACAFVSMLLLHVLFSINPHGIFTAVNNQPQVLQYLFLLVISGYSITSAKDIVPQISTILGGLFGKKPNPPASPAASSSTNPSDQANT